MANSTAITGYSIVTSTVQPNAGTVFIQLKDWDERQDASEHASAITRYLNGRFAREIVGGAAFAFGPPGIPGLGTGSGFSMMLQDRGGNTPDYLFDQAQARAQDRRVACLSWF